MKLKSLIFAAMAGITLPVLPSLADELPNGPHVVTTGQARVDATPDIATLTIDVSVTNNNAAEAKKQVDARMAQYFDFLHKNGIEKKDIEAANVTTRPEYDYSKEGKSQLKGYLAERQIQVILRDLTKLNGLLDGALQAGLNEIRSVELGVASPEQYKEKARQRAIDNATRQASALAQGFNTRLGPVWSIRYQVNNYRPVPVTRMYKAEAAADTSADQTYEQQNIHFDDRVDVVFELQRADSEKK